MTREERLEAALRRIIETGLSSQAEAQAVDALASAACPRCGEAGKHGCGPAHKTLTGQPLSLRILECIHKRHESDGSDYSRCAWCGKPWPCVDRVESEQAIVAAPPPESAIRREAPSGELFAEMMRDPGTREATFDAVRAGALEEAAQLVQADRYPDYVADRSEYNARADRLATRIRALAEGKQGDAG